MYRVVREHADTMVGCEAALHTQHCHTGTRHGPRLPCSAHQEACTVEMTSEQSCRMQNIILTLNWWLGCRDATADH